MFISHYWTAQLWVSHVCVCVKYLRALNDLTDLLPEPLCRKEDTNSNLLITITQWHNDNVDCVLLMNSLKVCTTNYQMCVFTLDTCQCVCCCCCGLVACGKCHVCDMCCMCCSCYSNPKSSGWVNGCMNEWVGEWVGVDSHASPPASSHSRVECQQVYISLPQLKCDCGLVQVLSAAAARSVHSPLFLAPYSSQQSALHTRTQRGRERESRLCHIVWANRQVALSVHRNCNTNRNPSPFPHPPRTNHTHQTVIQYL